MIIVGEDRVWAGSETSLRSALQAEEHINAKADCSQCAETQQPPRLLSIVDGLATIDIKGPLVNSDSDWLQYFGMTGYPEIRDALLAAANDPTVYQILLDVDSGGGSVSGVDDTANLIRAINDKVKPVTTYADNMASAAYWLGCSAGDVYAGKAAMVGSIGVIATFKEYTKANEKDGVTVTVIRAGKEKALANSNEKLTPKAQAQIQAMVDASYGIFVDHVAAMRDVSYAVADKQMADGQEFIGKAAIDAGLVDDVKTFDAVVTDLKGKILAYKENLMHNRGNGGAKGGRSASTTSGEMNMARQALSEQDIAALAAGSTLDAAASSAISGEVIAEAVAAAVAASEGDPVEGLNAESAVDAKDANLSATVQLLNSQLKEKDSALLLAGIENAQLKEKLVAAEATHNPLLAIAIKSINNMQIAMGGSAMTLEGLSATAVLEQHGAVSEQFKVKFKSGGVAAVTGDSTANTQPQVDPRHLARVNAARFNQSK